MNKASLIKIFPGSYTHLDITAEAITIPAGAIGTIKDFYFDKKPIANNKKNYIGGDGDTCIVLTSATFTNEVASNTLDADLANGDYWIDYITGRGRGKKADTGVSMTANYSIFI